ncbi:ATP-binding protein [Streptomyces sp. NPDC093260]|uniref:ATP-binding protein n=1 Tax=Streptomyces sp. NPDC093260 TaxID=3155073 RepID=UPI003448F31F
MWNLPFSAEAEEVAGLRRLLRLHLELWNVQELSDAAQLCVSELVANVIKHVGHGTPATLAVSMTDARLRIEVHDPDPRALPALSDADLGAEAGRGMVLIDAIADRWGVDLTAGRKSTWCELSVSPADINGHAAAHRVARAAGMLGFYARATMPQQGVAFSRLGATLAEETAIDVMTDLLHWFHAHGQDPDDVLDRVQAHFEAEAEPAIGRHDVPQSRLS